MNIIPALKRVGVELTGGAWRLSRALTVAAALTVTGTLTGVALTLTGTLTGVAATFSGLLTGAAATLSGVLTLSTGQKIIGSQFVITMPATAAAQFIAPAACKVVRVDEIHGTVAGQACTYQIEKCTGTQAPGSGTTILSAAFDVTSTINTVVSKTAFSGTAGVDAVLAAGNRLAPKVASGSATGLAGLNFTLVLEWV